MGEGPSDPLALADKVFMVSQTPNVQVNATLPAQDSSNSITKIVVTVLLQTLCTERALRIVTPAAQHSCQILTIWVNIARILFDCQQTMYPSNSFSAGHLTKMSPPF